MFGVLACLLGIFAILILNEYLYKRNLLKGELKRKLVHILAACFIATWPWLISWKSIQVIGIAMVAVLVINRKIKVLNYLGGVRKDSYGDIFLAIATTAAAFFTDNNIFFAVAILHVALADGLAATIGTKFGQKWRYEVFGYKKTIVGSMVFWVTSIFILGIGLLGAYETIQFSTYAKIIILLPPALTILENLAIKGSDNLVLPLAIIYVLNTVQLS